MKVPMTILRERLVVDIVKLLNGTELPAFVKLEVLEKCVTQLKDIAQKEYEQDLANYKQELEQGVSADGGQADS